MKIRLIGTHAEVSNGITELTHLFAVVSASRPYPVFRRSRGVNRVVPGMVRVYLEVTR